MGAVSAFPRAIRLVVNGDDFGQSGEVNAAIIQAHRSGILTAASLMPAGEAAEEALVLARATPSLAVGLHLVAAGGRSILPHRLIPHLVDANDRFPESSLQAGLRYASSEQAQRELDSELRAQFEALAASGLPLAHVDSHMHLHMHPTVLPIVVELAVEFGAGGLRVPSDDLGLALGYSLQRVVQKTAWHLVFAGLAAWGRRKIGASGLATAGRVYGLMQSGQMSEDYVCRLLSTLKPGTAEIYFHPSTHPQRESLGPNPVDLATLISPRIRRQIEARGILLSTYPGLAKGAGYARKNIVLTHPG